MLIFKRNINTKTIVHYVKMMTSSENTGIQNNACQMNVYRTLYTILTTHIDQGKHSTIVFSYTFCLNINQDDEN